MEGRVDLTVYIGLVGRSPPVGRIGGDAVRLLVVVEASQAGGRVAADGPLAAAFCTAPA